METVSLSETLVSACKSTRRYNPEEQYQYPHRRDSLRSYISLTGEAKFSFIHGTGLQGHLHLKGEYARWLGCMLRLNSKRPVLAYVPILHHFFNSFTVNNLHLLLVRE
jgi:hypothetical protein